MSKLKKSIALSSARHASWLLILLLLAPSPNAFSLPARSQDANGLTVALVLSNVRKALGHDRLKNLKRGFMVEEVEGADEAGGVRVFSFGPRGEFREEAKPTNNRPLGFDGRFGWQFDRTGFPVPLAQRLREKLLIPAWVRSGWWLHETAPLVFTLLLEETNREQVALSLKLQRGLVGAKIYIDRGTWLPVKLVVEYERGPYTVSFKDYRETLGFRFPRAIIVNYRGGDSVYQVKTVGEINRAAGDLFATPEPPPDTTFNNSLPAELKVAQGIPFSEKSDGHYYVRPLIDGRDVGWFHFDSGGDVMHIDTKLADELKMPVLGKSQNRGADGRVQEVTIRQGKTFQLGRVTYQNPVYIAMDLSDRNAPAGEKRAGLVGYPLFARVVLEVEGGGKAIRLYEPASYRLKKGKWQELFYIDLTPAVHCRFEGNRVGLFQLDTGYTGTVTFYDKFIADEQLLEGRAVKEEMSLGAGGAYKLGTGTIEWFELAGHRFKNPRAGFRIEGYSREGGAGVVGREFLAPFTIVFNYPEKRIAFLKN